MRFSSAPKLIPASSTQLKAKSKSYTPAKTPDAINGGRNLPLLVRPVDELDRHISLDAEIIKCPHNFIGSNHPDRTIITPGVRLTVEMTANHQRWCLSGSSGSRRENAADLINGDLEARLSAPTNEALTGIPVDVRQCKAMQATPRSRSETRDIIKCFCQSVQVDLQHCTLLNSLRK